MHVNVTAWIPYGKPYADSSKAIAAARRLYVFHENVKVKSVKGKFVVLYWNREKKHSNV